MTDLYVNAIRTYRLRKGWTQTELARRIGSDRRVISEYERGETVPSLLSALAIAYALDQPIECVFFELVRRSQDLVALGLLRVPEAET